MICFMPMFRIPREGGKLYVWKRMYLFICLKGDSEKLYSMGYFYRQMVDGVQIWTEVYENIPSSWDREDCIEADVDYLETA